MDRFVEWNERLFEEPAQPLSDEKLRQMVLQLAHAMLAEQLHCGLDFGWQGRGIFDRDTQHRLQRRIGERHHRACPPSLRQELLDQLEARNLVRRIDAIAESVARRIGKAIPALPHVKLLTPQAGDSHDLADVQGGAGVDAGRRGDQRRVVIATARWRLDQDTHESPLPILCATSIEKSIVRFSLTHLRQVSPRCVSRMGHLPVRIAPT